MSTEVLKAIAVTAELCGTDLSAEAARVFAADLDRFPARAVLGALSRCRREVKGRLSLADVIQRIDDGRPGPEEAWSMLPRVEDDTVVWTEEMREAAGPALRLMAEGDAVAARMAFRERYSALVSKARDAARPVVWGVSLGFDVQGRKSAVLAAVQAGRLTQDEAICLLPEIQYEVPFIALPSGEAPPVKRIGEVA